MSSPGARAGPVVRSVRADLHSHTYASRDSRLAIDDIIRVNVERGINCVAVTDHNLIGGAWELKARAPFQVIVGEEIRTTHGEIIGLFLEREIPMGLSPLRTVQAIREQGGVVYVPHPYDRVRRRSVLREPAMLEIIEHVDVVEVFNARCTFRGDIARAEALADKFGKLKGAGSDAHTRWECGNAYVELPPFDGPEELKRALARGRVVGRLTTPFIHVATRWDRLRKRMAGEPERR